MCSTSNGTVQLGQTVQCIAMQCIAMAEKCIEKCIALQWLKSVLYDIISCQTRLYLTISQARAIGVLKVDVGVPAELVLVERDVDAALLCTCQRMTFYAPVYCLQYLSHAPLWGQGRLMGVTVELPWYLAPHVF